MTGDEFRTARESLKLTQAALGNLLSISTSSIHRLEERREVPRTIALAMNSLGVAIADQGRSEALALAPELVQTAYNEITLRHLGQHQAAQAAKQRVSELLKRMADAAAQPDPDPTTEIDP